MGIFRFYFPYGISSPISVTQSTEWDFGSSSFLWCSTIKQNTISESLGIYGSEIEQSKPWKNLGGIFITDPLEAVFLSGTIKGQIKVRQPREIDEWCRAIIVKVVNHDGDIERGVIFSHFPETLISEWDYYNCVNRNFPPEMDLSSLEIQRGDRLVFEIGAHCWQDGISQGFVNGDIIVGDNNEIDLPENETEFLNDYNPWIEFNLSNDIIFTNQVLVFQNYGNIVTQKFPKLKVFGNYARINYQKESRLKMLQQIAEVATLKHPKAKIFQVFAQVLYRKIITGSVSDSVLFSETFEFLDAEEGNVSDDFILLEVKNSSIDYGAEKIFKADKKVFNFLAEKEFDFKSNKKTFTFYAKAK